MKFLKKLLNKVMRSILQFIIPVVILGLVVMGCNNDEISPASIKISINEYDFGSTETEIQLTIINAGNEELKWNASHSEDWSSSSSSTDVIAGNSSFNIEITVDRTGLSEGDYSGVFFIKSNGGNVGMELKMNVPASNRTIVYMQESTVFTMNSDGSDQKAITPQGYLFPKISSDGQKVICEKNYNINDRGIMIMNIDGTSIEKLTEGTWNFGPNISNDGNQIVFMRYVESAESNYQILKMKSDGTNVVQLTNYGWNTDVYDPIFSPDDTKILFSYKTTADGDLEIAIMNSDGSNVNILTDNTGDDYEPSFSDDGSKIIFTSNRDGDSEIFTMNSDGTNQQQLTNNNSRDYFPRYGSSDQILFSSDRDGDDEVYIMDKYGNNIKQLTNNNIRDDYADW